MCPNSVFQQRISRVLDETAYSEDAVREIAEAGSGNITLSLNLLRTVTLKAEREDKDSIEDVELDYDMNCECEQLNADERILVKILQEERRLQSGRLYGFYSQKAKHPKSRRSFGNYMQNLCTMGLVKRVGKKRARLYELTNGTPKDTTSGKQRRWCEE